MTLIRTAVDGAFSHVSEKDFLATDPKPGIHEIDLGGQSLDVQFIDNGSDVTMIGFHSSLPVTAKLPMFSGGTLAADVGMNFIGISDPSLVMGPCYLAWYLGNQVIGQLEPRLVPVISHLLNGKKAVLFGASGGGYAAVKYAKNFPDSTVVVANPRLNMLKKPKANILRYAQVCHGIDGLTPISQMKSEWIVEDLGDYYSGGLNFDLILMQNQQDMDFREGQAEPFLNKIGSEDRLTYIELYNGEGHVQVPRATLLSALKEAAASI